MTKKLGIIGGSGLYEMDGLENVAEHRVETPFGDPSDAIVSGTMNGTELFFLPRHGKGHRFLPGEVNYRANIYALKSLGVEWVLSVSAVGSMKEEIKPGDLVIPDQMMDLTKHRTSTFFGNGVVAHVSVADPLCHALRETLLGCVKEVGGDHHFGGTYICMEGPQFSSRAESLFYRSLGVSVIGMTNMPEAKLAREAEMSYATLALSTDYDCWHQGQEDVDAQSVIEVMQANVKKAKEVITHMSQQMPEGPSPFAGTSRAGIVTSQELWTADHKKMFSVLFGD